MRTALRTLLLLGGLLCAANAAAGERRVRMAVFEAEPLVMDAAGEPRGLYVDILEHVAAARGWRVEYVPREWEEAKRAVRAGEIDLLPCIAYTATRDSVLDFNRESVLTVWNQVFVREGDVVRHVLDLDGRSVAMVAGDINHGYLLDLARDAGARITIVDVAAIDDVFEAVARGHADVGVATNVYGFLNAAGYGLRASPMAFAPFSMRFATAEGANADVLAAIDEAMATWLQKDDSFYYQRVNHWYGDGRFGGDPVPRWVGIGAMAAVGLVALLVLWNRLLNVRVRRRTGQLQRSEERFRALFEAAGDAIFLMDGMRVIECNDRSLEMYGRPRDEIIGNTPDRLSPPRQMDGRDSREAALARLDAIAVGETVTFPWLHERGDGTPFDAEVTLTRFRAGARDYVQAIVRDVTERRQLEADLRQAQKMEAIGTLAGGIAHDFNNILSAILGYGELARLDAPAGTELRANLDQVHKASERARALVQQILAFSRRGHEEREPLTVAPIVTEILELLRSTIPANITVAHDLRSEGPVRGDATAIYQVLMNLCTNAIQAMGEAGGRLTLSLAETTLADGGELPAGRYVVVEVADTGPGMDEETRQKIFEPYFTTKTGGRGTGLGLAVVHGILTDHGGHVAVDSRPGEGARFRVLLPYCGEAATPDVPEDTAESARGREHVLLVDDEPDIIGYCRPGLERLGYRVTGCEDPEEALKLFRCDPDVFDVLVTDMTMPGMTGLALTAAARELRPGLPVVLCTGHANGVTAGTPAVLDVSAVLVKPLAAEDLAAAIRRVVANAAVNP